MENLTSLSILVGTGQCNANCSFCAGKSLRDYAPKIDGIIDKELFSKTLKQCYERGAKYLSISSCGEPTLSPLAVTKTLELVDACRNNGIIYSPVNLYSNGIRIGNEEKFCQQYLSFWQNLGLTIVYVTVHDVDEKNNAKIYGIDNYPLLAKVFSRIKESRLLLRANLVLHREITGSLERFIKSVGTLRKLGADQISTWPLRNLTDDKIDYQLSPSKEELVKINRWIQENYSTDFKIRLISEEEPVHYSKNNKLTLFPDGSLSSNWCNR